MRKAGVLLVGLLLNFLFSIAQISLDNTFNTVIPPSPDASSLGKYGSIPVNYSTGIPGISVPIYTVQAHGVNVPISIDYHAGGIKVEEMASWVGLGWSLNAGGVITRSVAGLPDETSSGYLNETNDIEGIPDLSPTDKSNVYDEVTNNLIDLQPDNFYFNLGSKSGRFFIDRNMNVKIIPANLNIKITFTTSVNIITAWQIIDEQGTVYAFKTPERSTTVRGSSGRTPSTPYPHFNSTWYLDQIVTILNDTVNFSYQDYTSDYYSRQMAMKYTSNTADGTGACTNQSGESHFYDHTTVLGKRISEIDFKSGKVIFTKSDADRTDVTNDYSLQAISIFNNDGLLLKKYNFSYSYFNSQALPPTILPPAYTTTRLRLDSIQIESPIAPPPYTFSYMSGILPSIFSFSQDHWGYYNGQNNSTLIPMAQIGQTLVTDRSVNVNYAQEGTLQRITYPTGGKTDFIYESNTATMPYSEYASHFLPYATSSAPNLKTEQVALFDTAIVKKRPPAPAQLYVDPNTVMVDAFGHNFNITIGTNNTNSCPRPSKLCSGQISVTVTCLSNPNIAPIYHLETYCTFTNGLGRGVVYLPPGETYEVRMLIGDAPSAVSLTGAYQYFPPSPTGSVTIPVGGLRVKKILNTPQQGSVLTKEYYYTDNLLHDSSVPDTLLESGSINGYPQYDYEGNYDVVSSSGSPGSSLTTCSYTIMASSSLAPLVSGGSATNYNSVQENSTSTQGRLKTLYKFTTSATAPDIINYSYPFTVENSFDYRRGLLLEQIDFNSTSEGYVPLHRKQYQYKLLNDTSIIGMKTACQTTLTNQAENTSSCSVIIFNRCYETTDRISKVSERDVQYDASYDSIVNQTDYFYDNPTHIFPTRTVTTNSKGQEQTTYMKYPLDFNGLSGSQSLTQGISNLQQKNDVSPVIEKYVQLKSASGTDSSILSASLISYSPAVPLPDTLWSTEFSMPSINFTPSTVVSGQIAKTALYKPQMMVNQYDISGNILQQKKVNDLSLSYIWDYNKYYPIAQAKGATTAHIAYTSFEADGTGNWTIGSAARDTTSGITGRKSYILNSDIFKSGLTSATTYTVSYWTTNNSAFTIAGTLTGYPIKGKTISINGTSWTLYTHRITGQTTITISGTGHVDELRLYPLGAQMTTYTFTPLVGMTSQADIGNRITYYEYDGLQRLKRIRDQDYNIFKTLEYQYQVGSGCGGNCYSIPMQNLAGTNTLGYPVGVFDLHGNLLGNATGPTQYVSLWNADTVDSQIGMLSTGTDSLHFSLTLNTDMTLPTAVTGCRYFQVDLTWNRLDAVRNFNGAYIDFGDGTGMRMGKTYTDTPSVIAPNTTYQTIFAGDFQTNENYYVHTYTDSSLKTLTCYHNDAAESEDFDNLSTGATGLTRLSNLRGNLPKNTPTIGGSCYQSSTMTSVAGILDWNSIQGIQNFRLNKGDGVNPARNIGYAQDFMVNNRGLVSILTSFGYYNNGCRDTSFRLSRLKTNWNTYFTGLQAIQINEDHWSHENLTALTQLQHLVIYATTQNHQDDQNSALIPMTSTEIDNILIQVAAGAGQTVSNGFIGLGSGSGNRTSASDAAVALLKSKGWTIYLHDSYQ